MQKGGLGISYVCVLLMLQVWLCFPFNQASGISNCSCVALLGKGTYKMISYSQGVWHLINQCPAWLLMPVAAYYY
jgi:hypothetical protein